MTMCQGGWPLFRSVYAGSSDGSIFHWILDVDYDTHRLCTSREVIYPRSTLKGHSGPVQDLIEILPAPFSPRTLISSAGDGAMIGWAPGGDIIYKFTGMQGLGQLAAYDDQFSLGEPHANRRWIVSPSSDGFQTIKVDGAKAEKSFQLYKGAAEIIHLAAVSGDHETSVTALYFEQVADSNGNMWVAVANQVKNLERENDWSVGMTLQHSRRVLQLLVDEKGYRVITLSLDNHIRIWDSRNGELVKQFPADLQNITGLTLINGKTWKGVVACSSSGTIRWWRMG
jgi:WD40 repeat protein